MIIMEKYLFRLNKLKKNSISKQRKITVTHKVQQKHLKTKPLLRDKNNKYKSITPEAKIKKRKT